MENKKKTSLEIEIDTKPIDAYIKNKGWYTQSNSEAKTQIRNMISGDNRLYLLVGIFEKEFDVELPGMPTFLYRDRRVVFSVEKNCTQIVEANVGLVDNYYDLYGMTSKIKKDLKEAGFPNSNIEVINGITRELDRDNKVVIYDIQSPIPEDIMRRLRQDLKKIF